MLEKSIFSWQHCCFVVALVYFQCLPLTGLILSLLEANSIQSGKVLVRHWRSPPAHRGTTNTPPINNHTRVALHNGQRLPAPVQDDQVGQHSGSMDLSTLPLRAALDDLRVRLLQASPVSSLHTSCLGQLGVRRLVVGCQVIDMCLYLGVSRGAWGGVCLCVGHGWSLRWVAQAFSSIRRSQIAVSGHGLTYTTPNSFTTPRCRLGLGADHHVASVL